MDRVKIDVIHNNKICNIDCHNSIYLSELCEVFNSNKKYIYSVFNEAFFEVNLKLYETDIVSGDIVFL
ncbi:MAG: hypothetical protein ACK5NF_05100 [Bacilli bacterium]